MHVPPAVHLEDKNIENACSNKNRGLCVVHISATANKELDKAMEEIISQNLKRKYGDDQHSGEALETLKAQVASAPDCYVGETSPHSPRQPSKDDP